MEHSRNPRSQTGVGVIQRRVFVSGRVQGVGFRVFVLDAAGNYPGLRGFVRNLKDGRVEAVFLGPEEAVLSLCAQCKKGPKHSQVTELEVKEERPDTSLKAFEIET